MCEALRRSEDAVTAHEAVLRAFRYFTRITADEQAVVRKILERAVREVPNHANSLLSSPPGISLRGPPRTVREPLDSYSSYGRLPGHHHSF